MVDEEVEKILARKASQLYRTAVERSAKPVKTSEEDPVEAVKKIVRGERADEIINTAVELYGNAAKSVFKRLLELYRNGQIGELHDYELYQILEQLGLHIPIKTRVRIVKRGGREESLDEALGK